MRKPQRRLATRAQEVAPPELALPAPAIPPPPPLPPRRPADRIKEALQRWLEEEL